MNTTQSYLPIKDIRDDLLILKDGSVVVVIKTSAVNFGLLSENEQLAIISSFAGLLNSLSFSIQIIISSKRLDISSYLSKLQAAQLDQKNPLLKDIMGRYRAFIEGVVRENDVLDKQFYIAIPVSYLELGVINDVEKHFQKAITVINPRRDHISRQLERIGLRATQLDSEQLTRLFYSIFNETDLSLQEVKEVQENQAVQRISQPIQIPIIPTEQPVIEKKQNKSSAPEVSTQNYTQETELQSTQNNTPIITASKSVEQTLQINNRPSPPFVVEELPDEYSSV